MVRSSAFEKVNSSRLDSPSSYFAKQSRSSALLIVKLGLSASRSQDSRASRFISVWMSHAAEIAVPERVTAGSEAVLPAGMMRRRNSCARPRNTFSGDLLQLTAVISSTTTTRHLVNRNQAFLPTRLETRLPNIPDMTPPNRRVLNSVSSPVIKAAVSAKEVSPFAMTRVAQNTAPNI